MTPQRALIEAAERAKLLLRGLTVGEVMGRGMEAINAAGLNPYCVNEGRATGEERISTDWLDAAIASAKAAEEKIDMRKAPEHAFELRITIGANEPDYVAEALSEIRDTINRSGIAGGCSGGWDGSWSIDVRKRDVTPDDYRDELEQWRQNLKTATVIEVREKP